MMMIFQFYLLIMMIFHSYVAVYQAGYIKVPEPRSPFPGSTPIAGAFVWKHRSIGPVWPVSRVANGGKQRMYGSKPYRSGD
jgi:hypothetical protein